MYFRIISLFVVAAFLQVVSSQSAAAAEGKAEINKRYLSVQSVAGVGGGYPGYSNYPSNSMAMSQLGMYPSMGSDSYYPPYVPGLPVYGSPSIFRTVFDTIRYIFYKIVSFPLRVIGFIKSILYYLFGIGSGSYYYGGGYPYPYGNYPQMY